MILEHTAVSSILLKDFGESFIKVMECRSLYSFTREIENISNDYNDYGYSDYTIDDDIISGKHKLIGDLFEIFAESFFKQLSSDNRIGIHNYRPTNPIDDNGVDGYGLNINGDKSTIQVKYRGNPTYLLKERDIKQFAFQSYINYGVELEKKDTMIIFTNCAGLHWYTENNVFLKKLRVINGAIIKSIVDNNEGFWSGFKTNIIDSVNNMNIEGLSRRFKDI